MMIYRETADSGREANISHAGLWALWPAGSGDGGEGTLQPVHLLRYGPACLQEQWRESTSPTQS